MSESGHLGLFEGFGIEIEYMIVDAEDLSVRPMADELLKAVSGSYQMEVDRGELCWSNELALHLIELKTNGPVSSLAGVSEAFQRDVAEINDLLAPSGARLLPSGMHPLMKPDELRLWPHEDDVIYRTLHRIFDCRGHGWSNLQSVHLNLPFRDDRELGRLHAAIRLVLPILPALAASSPYVDGRASGLLDTRLDVYRTNARRIPLVTGRVIPEPVFTQAEYEGLLESIYADLRPLDPEGILQHEWVNARGCIARFDRMALEIRLLDVQECPRMDLAVAQAVVAAVQALVEERWASFDEQRAWSEHDLEPILRATIRDAEHAIIADERFTRIFGVRSTGSVRAVDLWQHLVDAEVAGLPDRAWALPALRTILKDGCLARRLLDAAGRSPSRESLQTVYGRLADCLARSQTFSVAP